MSMSTKDAAMAPQQQEILPEHNNMAVHQIEDSAIDNVSMSKSDMKAPQEEDDPHVAAFQDDAGAHEGIDMATYVAIFFLGLAIVCPMTCGQLLIGPILTPVNAELGGGYDSSWVISGWGISSSISSAIAGRLSDIFGRRYVILLGEVIAIVGAIVAATAQSMTTLIAGSTLLGLAVGPILVIFTAIPELCPYKYRGLGLAWIEFCLFVPWGAVSALLSNLLYEHASWRWVYYIAIIYATISLVGTAVFYFPPSKGMKNGSVKRWVAFTQLDFIGILLYTAGLVLLLLGLGWGGTAGHPWQSGSVLAPLIIGAVTLVACFTYDFMLVDDAKAFFPRHLFRRFRELTVLLAISFVAGMIYYSMIGLLPEATLFIYTNNPTQLGITLIPNSMGQFFGSTVVPALLHLSRAPKFFIVAGTFLMTLFTALYAYALHDHKGAWMAFQFFGQGCFDWITTCTIVNISLHVPYSDMGLAIGLVGTFRSLGGSVGNAIFQAVLGSSLDKRLGSSIAAAALSNGFNAADLELLVLAVINNASGAPDAFAGIPNVTAAVLASTAEACRNAYIYAFERVFYASIPFGVFACFAALFISDAGKYMTNHISVHMNKSAIGHKAKSNHQENVELHHQP